MNKAKAVMLEQLADDLEGSLHMIAHAGFADDPDWISQRIADLKRGYGGRVAKGSEDLMQTTGLKDAEIVYGIFIHMLDGNPSPIHLKSNCEGLLGDYFLDHC
jgi:hypothetical protein